MAKLSVTSYALLALLSQRPYTAYELANTLRKDLSMCMPRSTSVLYNEPKVLVELGLAVVREEMKGRQKRSVYSITPAGRRKLRTWFKQPSAAPVFESEAVVRVIFGHAGPRADLVATLAELETQVHQYIDDATAEMPAWLERVQATPEHLHDMSLIMRLYMDYCALLVSWSRWAREQINEGPPPLPDGEELNVPEFLKTVVGEAVMQAMIERANAPKAP